MTLTGTITGVAESAFRYNENLLSITLPATLTEIGSYAFIGTNRLADVYCDADAADVKWEDNANTYQFMEDKATLFHVTDAAAWKAKFPDANVTFVDGSETAIKQIASSTTDKGVIYNLSGQRVNNHYKGVTIVNGRKVVNK